MVFPTRLGTFYLLVHEKVELDIGSGVNKIGHTPSSQFVILSLSPVHWTFHKLEKCFQLCPLLMGRKELTRSLRAINLLAL